VTAITSDAMDVLEQYPWHGNIRELENVIHRCSVLAKSDVIDAGDLPAELVEQTINDPSFKIGKSLLDAENEFRRLYIIKTLRRCGSVSEAARHQSDAFLQAAEPAGD
jgi:DNA-binding NtrC family response regulator